MVAMSRKATTPSAITSGRDRPCCAGGGAYDGYGAGAKAGAPCGADVCGCAAAPGDGRSRNPLGAWPLPPAAGPGDADGRSSRPPPPGEIDSLGPVSPSSDRGAAGLERADISSFTSDASAEAAEGCQPPVSPAGSAPSPAAAMLTGISVRMLCDIPPELKEGSTGMVTTVPLPGPTNPGDEPIIGLDGLGASTDLRSATSESGVQSE